MFFKETDFKTASIGAVPKEWKVTSLDSVAEIRCNKGIKSAEKIAFIPMEAVPDSQVFAKYQIRRRKDIKSYTYCEAGDLLLAKITPSLENGKQGIVPSDVPNNVALATTEVFPIHTTEVNALFLFYVLKSSKFRNKIISSMIGTTGRQRASKESVERLEIPLPHPEEQQRITEVFSAVDSAIELTDKVIAKTERLKKGLMQQLLTRGIGHTEFKKSRVGEIPVDWEITKLGEIAEIRYGLGQPPESDKNGISMIRATNIDRGTIVETDMLRVKRSTIPESRMTLLREGDLIVVRSGAYTGDIGYITRKWEGSIAGYDLVVSPSNRVSSMYLAYYLLSSKAQTYFSQLKSRSAQPHLNSEQVSGTPITLPSPPEQELIADILSTIDKKRSFERNGRAKLGIIKRGLMDLLLTGKVRIKVD